MKFFVSLVEFGETPSSSLTLDEFMSVDLEEEHDPPSFKAARMKDREQLQRVIIWNLYSLVFKPIIMNAFLLQLLEDEGVRQEFLDFQKRIDDELDKRHAKALEREKESMILFCFLKPSCFCFVTFSIKKIFTFESVCSTHDLKAAGVRSKGG